MPSRVGRRSPPTAQPITAVSLTTFPPYNWQMDNLGENWLRRAVEHEVRYFAIDALENRWPGITFTLPPA